MPASRHPPDLLEHVTDGIGVQLFEQTFEDHARKSPDGDDRIRRDLLRRPHRHDLGDLREPGLRDDPQRFELPLERLDVVVVARKEQRQVARQEHELAPAAEVRRHHVVRSDARQLPKALELRRGDDRQHRIIGREGHWARAPRSAAQCRFVSSLTESCFFSSLSGGGTETTSQDSRRQLPFTPRLAKPAATESMTRTGRSGSSGQRG